MSRRDVRNAFKTAISSVYTGPIYTSRLNDNRDDESFASVYINSGDLEHNFSNVETELELTIKYAENGATDDELDRMMDQIVDSIASSEIVKAAVGNPLLIGFDYDEESDDMSAIKYTYKVIY